MPTANEVSGGHKESQLLGFREDEKTGAMPKASEVGSGRKNGKLVLYSPSHKRADTRGW